MTVLSEPKLRGLPVLVLANKADQSGAATAEAIAAALDLGAVASFHVQSCSALAGQGVQAGFAWLCTKLE